MSTGASSYGRSAKNPYYKSSKQLRYENYQKHLARQAEIQAANAKKAQRRKLIAGTVGAIAVGAVGGTAAYRRGVAKATLRNAQGGMATGPVRRSSPAGSTAGNPVGVRKPSGGKISLVHPRSMGPQRPGPVQASTTVTGSKVTKTSVSPQNKAGVQNPTPSKQYAVTKAGGAKSRGARNDNVVILRGNAVSEVAEIRKRRRTDSEQLNKMIKDAGLGIKYDKYGRRLTEGKSLKREAAIERERDKGARKRANDIRGNSNAIRIARKEARKRKYESYSVKSRAADRYANILMGMQESGQKLNRTQRQFLAGL